MKSDDACRPSVDTCLHADRSRSTARTGPPHGTNRTMNTGKNSISLTLARLTLLTLASSNLLASDQPVQTLHRPSTGIGDAIAVGPNGDIFGCPGRGIETVIRITPQGERSIFAQGHGSPTGIDFDSQGNLIVVNYRQNNVVKYTPDGEASVVASGLNGPAHLVVNGNDEIFVSEFGANFSGTGSRVVKIDRSGAVSDYLVGQGLQDVIGLALDEDENLYVGNWQSGQIYRSTGPGELELFADIRGNVNQIGYHQGFVYAPASDRRIYRIDRNGTIHHFAGNPRSRRNDGTLLDAGFPLPNSIAFSNDGNTIYVNDSPDGALRSLSLSHDSDGDGVTDADEQIPGTDPQNPASLFQLSPRHQPDGSLHFEWPGIEGRDYEIQFSTNLSEWTRIATRQAEESGPLSYQAETGQPQGFFRLEIR